MEQKNKVTASDSIIEIAGSADTSGKLNMWAEYLQRVSIVCAVIILFAGIILLYQESYGISILIIAIGIIQGLLSFFYVHVLRAFAIITEAASIIVLEHQSSEE